MGVSHGYTSTSSILILLAVVSVAAAIQVDMHTTLQCHIRKYKYRINKPFTTETGAVLPCSGVVEVQSCWGRCDSSEIPDYVVPYKVSNHPVCTYSKKRPRIVTLQNCHPLHPEPQEEVFDAIACNCQRCDSGDVSCENLNG